MGPWQAVGQLAWVWPLPVDAVAEAGGPGQDHEAVDKDDGWTWRGDDDGCSHDADDVKESACCGCLGGWAAVCCLSGSGGCAGLTEPVVVLGDGGDGGGSG